MFGKKTVANQFAGTVLFPSDTPPHPEIWDRLRNEGFTVQDAEEGSEGVAWIRKISHAKWGAGKLVRFTDSMLPPPECVDCSASLTHFEKKDIGNYRATIGYIADDHESTRPEKRKNHFRILRAIMGDQAEYMIDHISGQIWSKTALDDELMHEEALGVRSLYELHMVRLADNLVRTSPPPG